MTAALTGVALGLALPILLGLLASAVHSYRTQRREWHGDDDSY